MCDQRERLIEYLYDECQADDRRAVEAHLSECAVCRDEIAGLRGVRQDVLAWDVPHHESVWRPFVAVQRAPSWRDLPAWGLAAAAALVFMAGAAGGAATRLLWPGPIGATSIQAAATPAPAATPVAAVTQADLARLEDTLLARMRSEMTVRLETVAAHTVTSAPAATPVRASAADLNALRARLAAVEGWKNKQIELNVKIDRRLNDFISRTASLSGVLAQQGMQRVSYEVR